MSLQPQPKTDFGMGFSLRELLDAITAAVGPDVPPEKVRIEFDGEASGFHIPHDDLPYMAFVTTRMTQGGRPPAPAPLERRHTLKIGITVRRP